MTNLSIIICCYNSVSRLEKTLEHISYQELHGLVCELVIVDNNCTDDTVSFAVSKWLELGHPFQIGIIEEKTPGLSFARKAGVLASKGEILIFCDDDNWLDENYCFNAWKTLNSDKQIAACCGQNFPKFDDNVNVPLWFERYMELYACGQLAPEYTCFTNRKPIWGAGMIIRSKFLKSIYNVGVKSLLSDRNEKNLSSGGDSEMSYWFILLGLKICYNPEIKLFHYIEKKRLDLSYRIKLEKSINISTKQLNYLYKPLFSAATPLRKLDFIKIFDLSNNGSSSRIKLRLFLFKTDRYFNFLNLMRLKKTLEF